jgi:phage baseplate assembly protein W
MAKQQFLGIKYPFKNDGVHNFYLDANETYKDQVRSDLLHVVFTPKGQRIRMPEFGTDLIKHIFSPNDDVTWEAIKTEVTDSVSRWVPNIQLNDINVVKNENDEAEIFVRLDYSVKEGNKITNDSVVVQI